MYGIRFDGYDDGERYETYEEAEEAACEMCSAFSQGSIDLYNENPGDYLEESDGNTANYDIFEA
jgi:hypothetical protein